MLAIKFVYKTPEDAAASSWGEYLLDHDGQTRLFDDGELAARIAREHNEYFRKCGNLNSQSRFRCRVVKLSTDASTPEAAKAWRERERARFASGEYKQIPWHDAPWFTASQYADLHFPHPSHDKVSMLAYTATDADGEADKQMRLKPGRYLEKYFGTILTGEEIRDWVAKYAVEFEGLELKFARTATEIEWVYRNGPPSCMSNPVCDYSSVVHPTAVYAGPDLCVAYLPDPNAPDKHVSARVVCWPDQKIYSRIYGDEGRLRPLLQAAGYQHGALDGARVQKIADGDGWVMPYVDNCGGAKLSGKYIELGDGPLSTGNTIGVTEDGSWECENCGGRTEDDANFIDGMNVCDSCASDAWTCYHCGDLHLSECEYHTHDGYDLCERCHTRYFAECEHCGETFAKTELHKDADGNPTCNGCLKTLILNPKTTRRLHRP